MSPANSHFYTITDLGKTNSTFAGAYDINNKGHVVGLNAAGHAFLYANGTMTDLGTLGGSPNSFATGINNQDLIVGYSNDHAFLYSNGEMSDLGTFDGVSSFAYGINDSGQISGTVYTGGVYPAGGPIRKGFIRSGNVIQVFGSYQNSFWTEALDINNQGIVVGTFPIQGDVTRHAFIFDGHTFKDLGTLPGGAWARAQAINDHNQVVGGAGNQSGEDRAFLYGNGAMKDLCAGLANDINHRGHVVGASGGNAFFYRNNALIDLNTLLPPNSGWVLQQAMAINDHDQIVGVGTVGGETHSFLISPN
jgi:probable HAF family extracellular repeat protein